MLGMTVLIAVLAAWATRHRKGWGGLARAVAYIQSLGATIGMFENPKEKK